MRDAAEALRVVSISSRNTAEKHTASSPICSMTDGGKSQPDRTGLGGEGRNQRAAVSGHQESGDRATSRIHDRDRAAAVGDAAAAGWEEPPAGAQSGGGEKAPGKNRPEGLKLEEQFI